MPALRRETMRISSHTLHLSQIVAHVGLGRRGSPWVRVPDFASLAGGGEGHRRAGERLQARRDASARIRAVGCGRVEGPVLRERGRGRGRERVSEICHACDRRRRTSVSPRSDCARSTATA